MVDDEIKELKEELKVLKKEVKALEKAQDDVKHYHDVEQDPRINRLISQVAKLAQRIK